MKAYVWLLGRIKKKYMKTYLWILFMMYISVILLRDNDVLSFSVCAVSFTMITKELFYQKYIGNNCISVYILLGDVKRMIREYIKHMIWLEALPLFVFAVYTMIKNDWGNAGFVLGLLLWCLSMLCLVCCVQLLFPTRIARMTEILCLMGSVFVSILYTMNEAACDMIMLVLMMITWFAIYRLYHMADKERLVRTII